MPRTTVDIDAAVLKRLRDRARHEGTTLGRLVSELLARALREEAAAKRSVVEWRTRPMRARVDLADKEAVRRALDES